MLSQRALVSVRTACAIFAWGVMAAVGTWTASARAEEESTVNDDVIMVEEDWEFVVREPDANVQGPQVTCVISPTGNVNGIFSAFDLNHQSLPSFQGGGMQLQVWNGTQSDIAANPPTNDALWHENEVVSWTQRMGLFGDVLGFQISEGHSTTWGNFGGEQLQNTIAAPVVSLNAYDPQVSVANSGVGFASNRVNSLTLKKVRYFGIHGLIREVTTPQVVFQRELSNAERTDD